MKTSIFATLKRLNLSSLEPRYAYNNKTRDSDDIVVWKDRLSGVVYLDDFYGGDSQYQTSRYKQGPNKTGHEEDNDSARRVRLHSAIISGKDLVDFGCGRGGFFEKG